MIRLGAPKRPTSNAPKPPTRWNSARRMSRPNAIDARDAKYDAVIAQTIWAMLTTSIQPPVRRM
ncbi:hypothetical protein GCM10009798_15600 [Nocardioides panacihumi]|uniref:Uncharacterized protein n=1 Tax=Nocardioides panacihumi TaxID=400774 RepID=A0ABP5C5N9_9ACTN